MADDPQHVQRGSREDELCILQILCQETTPSALRVRASALLAGYRFRHPLYQLVFDALRSLSPSPPETFRAALINRLTNLGFPDVDVEPFFRRHDMTDELALSMIERLALPHPRSPRMKTTPR